MYENPAYDSQLTDVILPTCNVRSIIFWGEYFFPFEPKKVDSTTEAAQDLASKTLTKRVEAMRERNLARHRLRLMYTCLKAFNENKYRKKLLHAEAYLVASSLVEQLVNAALRSSAGEVWTSIHAEADEGSHDDLESGFVMV